MWRNTCEQVLLVSERIRKTMGSEEVTQRLTVAPAIWAQVIGMAKTLAIGIFAFAFVLILGANPGRAAHAFAFGAIAFGGWMFAFFALAVALSRLRPKSRRRGARVAEQLPPTAVVVSPFRLLTRNAALDLGVIGGFVVCYFIRGPIFVALLAGFSPGVLLAVLPFWGYGVLRERRKSRELFVAIDTRNRRLFERQLGAEVDRAPWS